MAEPLAQSAPSHAPSARPKRRWLSYSLRTLLLAVTLLCVWLGVAVNQANQQRRAVEAIEKLDVQVRYGDQSQSGRARTGSTKLVDPPWWQYAWLRNLLGRDYFDTAIDVRFNCGKVNGPMGGLVNVYYDDARMDAILEQAAQLRGLKHLGGWSSQPGRLLPWPRVSDANLALLKNLIELESISLDFERVTDEGLVHIQRLTQLKELCLIGGNVTDAGVAYIRGMNRMERVFLYKCSITDAGLRYLEGFSQLKLLDLTGAQITDSGLTQLVGLSQLTELTLDDTPITDDGLEKLQHLVRLETLNLRHTKITDAGLEHLLGMPRLSQLHVEGTKVTVAGAQKIKNALLRVHTYPYETLRGERTANPTVAE